LHLRQLARGFVQQGGVARRDRAEAAGEDDRDRRYRLDPALQGGRPRPRLSAPVERFRAQIAAADGLLFVTPEYNYSMSGVLKSAIDWASRPPDQPFAGKPAAIMGAAAGRAGSARAQYDLRRSCVFLDIHPLNKPEVPIGQAQTKADAVRGIGDPLRPRWQPYPGSFNWGQVERAQ
jgi:NAD(P)H-dependent FMN reductase